MKELKNSEIKNLLLNILKEIDEFCSKNNLTYFLAYGTLLGAVRHKGFIPWDDDIDICMPRPDYEKFISSFMEKHGRYVVKSFEKDKEYPYFFAKVHDKNTLLKTKTTFDGKMGLYVDIFPIDALPSNITLQKRYMRKFNFYRNLYTLKAMKFDKNRSLFKNIILFISRFVTSIFPLSFLIKKIDKISRTYKYNDYDFVSISATSDQRLILNKDLFASSIRIEFEGIDVAAPIGYIEILKKNYGDYLKLPPVEKQVSNHGFKVFKLI